MKIQIEKHKKSIYYLTQYIFILYLFDMSIVKIIQGSFHQGNEMFRESAGKQCTCNSLMSLAFTLVKTPGHWDKYDLDFILVNGDNMYKDLNSSKDYLSITELPKFISFYDSGIEFIHFEYRFGFLNGLHNPLGIIFEHNITSDSATGFLFIVKNVCIAVMWTKKHFFLFDSHSRNELGKSCSEGSSILLKFSTRNAVERHIIQTYLTEGDKNIQFEVQYIQAVRMDNTIDLSQHYYAMREQMRKSSPLAKALCRQRKSSEVEKEKCRKRKAAKKHTSSTSNTSCNATKKKKELGKEKNKKTNSVCYVDSFKRAIKEGPYYFCTVCNRCLYRKTVIVFNQSRYDQSFSFLFTNVQSFNSNVYICATCDRHIVKKQIPCQSVWNKLIVDELPNEIKVLNHLEKILISKRILFKKISIMPKGQQPKIRGAICNIPVHVEAVSECLPRPPDSNGIILVKLKRKLLFRGHVYFESVRPECIRTALEVLKLQNPFYSNVLISIDNINKEFLSLSDIETAVEKDEFPIEVDIEENLEDENPHDNNRVTSSEMIIIPNTYSEVDDQFQVAPGENKTPQSFFDDAFCEEQAFPYLLPKGKYGYKVTRPVALSAVRYFNQRLLNYTQRFASNADYIFFAHYVMQQINLFNQINIATNKIKGSLNAGQLRKNYKETVRSFICEERGYMFMKQIKGTPAYWKQFLYDVLAMVKQLGLPTFFLTLSCADLKWEELSDIISRLNNLGHVDSSNVNYFQKCEILNQNPVLTARHFQFRVETFFKEVILNKHGPLGKVEYYVIKVEFQFRGSPHIHSFIWLKNPIQLEINTVNEYIEFIDSVVRADMPDEQNEPDLFRLVSQYQVHKHSRSCRKYKNVPCRFNYGRYFTDRTIVAVPLDDKHILPGTNKAEILHNRSILLKKVKNYIDNFLDPQKSCYIRDTTIQEILTALDVSEEDYYNALSIASSEDFEIHLRKPPDSCFVNNYSPICLLAWEANIDIQPVFNYYKAISYMCSYFSKSETESSVAMKKAAEEACDLSYKDKMKKLAIAFLSHRQCSLQEAVYQLMPELWLKKTFPAVIFANTNLPDKRFRVCKSEQELAELHEDSTDVFKKNNLDRYMDRPNASFKGGKYAILQDFCYAQFLSFYVLDTKPDFEQNDNQPELLVDDFSVSQTHYPKLIPLMSSKEKMRCRNMKRVIRFHTPNRITNVEAWAHHLLMLYYPFRNESDLSSSENNTYFSKLNEPSVFNIVNENKLKYEPWGDIVDEVLLNNTSQPRTDQFAQQENDDLCDQAGENYDSAQDEEITENVVDFQLQSQNATDICSTYSDVMTDDEINNMVASLNSKQRYFFNLIHSWARKKVASTSFEKSVETEPLQLFITGGAGTGKSHLIKTIYATLTKTLSYHATDIDKPKVILLAPTGVAAVNIGGSTIHSALGIPVDCRGLHVPKLSDKKRCALRAKFENLQAIIIDEISMVPNKLLLYIHQRLLDIFGYTGNCMKPFAGRTMIVVGDLYQLPPVLQRPVYADYYDEMYNIFHLWRVFKLCELTEVMRQKGDNTLIDLLNNIRVGNLSANDEQILRSKFISKDSVEYPMDALHIFAENEPAMRHNFLMIERLDSPLFIIEAIDQVPRSVPKHVYTKILNLSQAKTNGLSFQLKVKLGARVMLTSNLDVSDRLINGQIGTVTKIKQKNDKVEVVYVKFDDLKAGQLRMKSNPGSQDSVPIERISTDIKTNKKDASPVVKRIQFPLTLAWACTVHKVQGLSLSQVVISFDLHRQKSFNYGQMYVALSRVTSLQGLFLIGEFKTNAIMADIRTTAEYKQLRQNQNFDQSNITETCTIIICNVRSLHKHIVDIRSDLRFTKSDFILCTETQISNEFKRWDDISLDNFSIHHNIGQHKFSSLAMYSRLNSDFREDFCAEGVSIFQILNANVQLKVLFLYRKKDWSLVNFYQTLQYLVTVNDLDIITGDFNISPNECIFSILKDYRQLVYEPTHLGGNILDHVYVSNSVLNRYSIAVSIERIFFSDHEAIKISVDHLSGNN